MSSVTAKNPTLEKIPVSPEPLYRLLFGRPITQILLTAYDLKVFGTLAQEPATLPELSRRLHLPEHSLDMLLHTSVALGLLRKEGERFHNSALAEQYLIEGKPYYLGGLIEHFRHQVFGAWEHLKEAILEDGPQMGKVMGKEKIDIFQMTEGADQQTELFISAMHNLSVSDGLLLAEHFDFSRFSHVLDVGGGSGALCLAIASRFPALRATVMDRPQVCQVAARYIEEAGLGERVNAYPGDAFQDPYPKEIDVVLFSLFLHAFGLKRSAPLLQKAFNALPSGGCVLIFEPVLQADRTGPLSTLLSSLNMLVVTPSGGDVTADEYCRWLSDQGFKDIFYEPVPAIRHLIGGFKP